MQIGLWGQSVLFRQHWCEWLGQPSGLMQLSTTMIDEGSPLTNLALIITGRKARGILFIMGYNRIK